MEQVGGGFSGRRETSITNDIRMPVESGGVWWRRVQCEGYSFVSWSLARQSEAKHGFFLFHAPLFGFFFGLCKVFSHHNCSAAGQEQWTQGSTCKNTMVESFAFGIRTMLWNGFEKKLSSCRRYLMILLLLVTWCWDRDHDLHMSTGTGTWAISQAVKWWIGEMLHQSGKGATQILSSPTWQVTKNLLITPC